MKDDQAFLDRMKRDLFVSVGPGLFPDLIAVVYSTIKLRRLSHPDRKAFDAMAERMLADVKASLDARLSAAEASLLGSSVESP